MSVDATELVVRKSLHVAAPVERAWEVFTERIAEWWPLQTHSVHHERAETVVLEREEGGRMYERTACTTEPVAIEAVVDVEIEAPAVANKVPDHLA